MARRSKSRKAKGQSEKDGSWGCFGFLFAVIGVAIFLYFSIWPLIQNADAQSWILTSCVIDSSELHVNQGDDGPTFRPDIRYNYAFGDGDYEGDRYTFVTVSTGARRKHQAVVDRYPPGSSATCYVNPNAPEESVLIKNVTSVYFVGFFGLIFVGAGCLAIYLERRENRGEGP